MEWDTIDWLLYLRDGYRIQQPSEGKALVIKRTCRQKPNPNSHQQSPNIFAGEKRNLQVYLATSFLSMHHENLCRSDQGFLHHWTVPSGQVIATVSPVDDLLSHKSQQPISQEELSDLPWCMLPGFGYSESESRHLVLHSKGMSWGDMVHPSLPGRSNCPCWAC